MLGGILRTSSVAAMMAVTGFVIGGSSAQAADLGGNCCADLEERVAELEATTARKGNRKVSLRVYGQISEAIIFWNDGAESNTYVLENYLNKNRLGFDGNAKINSDWSAGYHIEVGYPRLPLEQREPVCAGRQQQLVGHHLQHPVGRTAAGELVATVEFLRADHGGPHERRG